MTDDPKITKSGRREAVATRRQMLMRLGLVAGAIYAAPTLASLSEARASSGRSFSSASGGRRRRRRHRVTTSFSSASRGRRRLRAHTGVRPRNAFDLASR